MQKKEERPEGSVKAAPLPHLASLFSRKKSEREKLKSDGGWNEREQYVGACMGGGKEGR